LVFRIISAATKIKLLKIKTRKLTRVLTAAVKRLNPNLSPAVETASDAKA
jgi:hypothetical protein